MAEQSIAEHGIAWQSRAEQSRAERSGAVLLWGRMLRYGMLGAPDQHKLHFSEKASIA